MMDKKSYLFLNHRKKLKYSQKVMDKDSSSDSNISVDSLERSFKWKANIKHKIHKENIDTILVPFYENDVLIRIPKTQRKITKNAQKCNEKMKKATNQMSYLINKDRQKSKKSSYLEMFRKQFTPHDIKSNEFEICSLSPEYGDTERDSFEDDVSNKVTEFCNTEAYNEIYYAKLLNQDIQNSTINSFEKEYKLTGDLDFESLSNHNTSPDNLRSISDVSNRGRRRRQLSVGPIQGIKFGGLGPDMETIKPRLERARSLQRYSEKVRMENRLKIYKRSNQVENNKKDTEKKAFSKCQLSKEHKRNIAASYLINKTTYNQELKSGDSKPKPEQKPKICDLKECGSKQGSGTKNKANSKLEPNNKQQNYIKRDWPAENKSRNPKLRLNSGSKTIGVNTDVDKVTPVHIHFMVNVRGAPTSSALETLEKKHRMYQEQVRGFADRR